MGGRGATGGLNRVGVRKLEKANKSHRKRIREHIEKIRYPERVYGKRVWHDFDSVEKEKRLNHWRSEIKALRKNIKKNKGKIDKWKQENSS